MENLLQQFVTKPFAGSFLIISEYRDGYGGGTAPVPDLITIDEDFESLDDPKDLAEDELYVGIPATCDSALWDSLTELEIWPNGEVYLGGDGVDHPRYRVTAMYSFAAKVTLDASDDLTEMRGEPVWWQVNEFTQESHDDLPGTRVEMGIWHHLQTMRPGWEFRKAFGESDVLVAVADAEFNKPKYGAVPRAIRVDGRVVKSWFADHMPTGHELESA